MGDIDLLGTDLYLPWWFPGAGFKKDAGMYKRRLDQCRDDLHEVAKRALVRMVLRLRTMFSQQPIRMKTGSLQSRHQ
jgi:hypothetical protein